jgi:putative FmdB family regulatory protein
LNSEVRPVPIHEYVCHGCRKILNFFVRGAEEKKPVCPHCGGKNLEKVMSRFAVKTAAKGGAPRPDAGGDAPGFDAGDGPEGPNPAQERRMESLMDEMGRDLDKIDENDPRQIGRFLRKFGEASGEDLGPEFREAVGRLEAGEDPEKVEEQLAEAFGGEGGEDAAGGGGSYTRDDTLYDM